MFSFTLQRSKSQVKQYGTRKNPKKENEHNTIIYCIFDLKQYIVFPKINFHVVEIANPKLNNLPTYYYTQIQRRKYSIPTRRYYLNTTKVTSKD